MALILCADAAADTLPFGHTAYGGPGSPGRVGIGSTNPAAPSTNDRRLRFGILADLGAGYEIGDATDFDRHIEDIADAFEDLERRLQELEGSSPTAGETRMLIEDIVWFEGVSNGLMRDLTDNAYAKIHAGASGPGAPLSMRLAGLGGVVTFDYAGYVEARVGVESAGDAFTSGLAGFDLDRLGAQSRVEIGETANGYAVLRIDAEDSGDFEEFAFRPNDDAGAAVQGGIVRRVSGGYARPVFSSPSGVLHAGATANFYRVTLARAGIRLDDIDDTEDAAEDEFRNSQERSSGFGLDAGVFWVSDRYVAGATLRNLNAPSFAYPDHCGNGTASSSCLFFEANPQARRNGDSWSMERQLTLEGSVHTDSRRWVGSARLDANSVADTTGDEYQWLAVHGRYLPARAWVPSPRLGYKKNLAGEEMSYWMLGATFFRSFHLDMARAMARTSFDGTSMPRALQLSLGMSLQF